MKKKHILRLVLVLIILVAVIIGLCSGIFSSPPPEQAEVEALLSNLSNGGSYRFTSQCYVTTEGEQREYFQLSGEKSGLNSHFQGSILGTEVELYLVDDTLYQRNGDGNWRVNQVPDVQQAVSLFAELDPASAFSYDSIEGFTYLGEAESDQGKNHLVELIPSAAGWVGQYFTDVRYQLWISCRERSLLRVELSGVLQDDPDTQLSLSLELYDVGQELVLTPPPLE